MIQYFKNIDQKTVADMNDQINQVIPGDIQSAKVIIKSKWEKAHIPASWQRKGGEVSDPGVLYNVTDVIILKGSGESIGVDKDG